MENKVKIKDTNSFEYFLNAVHYCIYQDFVRSNHFVEKIVWKCFFAVAKVFSLEERCNKRKEKLDNDVKGQDYMYGNNIGQSIGLANHWFGYFYSSYPALLSFVLLGIVFRYFEGTSPLVRLLVISIPIGLFYIPAYRAVFSKDRYLKYHKQFEQNDEQWHKKWKRVTIGFCIGGIIITFLGIGAMWVVLLL